MKPALLADFLAALKEREFARPGDRLGVAVSGGADSVALLRLFHALRERLGIVLHVLHFNHKLRGRASDGDEQFVNKLASHLDLEFHVGRADVGRLAQRSKSNLEDAGRRARYEWFARIAEEQHLVHVATAHTADDQAETVLAHILRGTGLAGLAGIHPVSGKVIRPLLGFRRPALRAYLKKVRQLWREDATNRDTHRTRSRIRRQLIPLLEKRFQPLTIEHLSALASRALENEALVAALSENARLSFVSTSPDGAKIATKDLLAPCSAEDPAALRALSSRLVLDRAGQVKPRSGQLTAQHVHAVLRLARDGEPGKFLQLRGGLRVRRERDALFFYSSR